MNTKADIRTGTPVWKQGELAPPTYPVLTQNLECDLLVVGAGISGALISYYLTQENLSVIVVDKDQPAQVSTAASTGLLQYEIDTPLCDLIEKVGETNAVHAYRRGIWAIDELEKLSERVGPSAQFSRRPSFYFASSICHVRKLEKEFRCRRKFDFDVQLLKKKEIKERMGFASFSALWTPRDAQINPLAFTRGLFRLAEEKGARIFGKTEVASVIESDSGVIAYLTSGHQVRAKRVVYATGYDASKFLSEKKGTFHTTFALASAPNQVPAAWSEGCLIWDTSNPYFYARQTTEGRVILGGEDTDFRKDHQSLDLQNRKTNKLLARFQRLFPKSHLVPEYRWAGTFGETKDGMAYIGMPPSHTKSYFALGYGGNGITFSVIAAKLITDLYLKRDNLDEAVFSFSR